MITPDQIFTRAAEEAALLVFWRAQAERMRDGTTAAGVDRRKALALARRCERTIFDLAILAEATAAGAVH
jgi:hypothetical protein